MNPAIATKALNYVAVSSALTKRALDELQVHRSAQKKASSIRPELLELMLKTGTAAAHQKEAADAMLASHPETLGLLKSAIEKIASLQEKLRDANVQLGEGVDPKEAGLGKTAGDKNYQGGRYTSLDDPYVGRKTGEKKASDEAILSVLNDPA